MTMPKQQVLHINAWQASGLSQGSRPTLPSIIYSI